MQKRIHHSLNRPFPLFLKNRKGRCYFIWLITFCIILANLTKPLGFINSPELHKSLLLDCYLFLFFFTYALLYIVLSYFCPEYYKSHTWTVRKELCTLSIYIPATALITYVYACTQVPDFQPGLPSFVQLQYYNLLISLVSIPAFVYFVDTRLNPITIDRRRSRREFRESHPNLSEQQTQKILQRLHHAMETDKLYLATECTLEYVSNRLNIPLHQLSYVINSQTAYNFNDFRNKYRVEEACRILRSGHNKKLKLESLRYDCGFQSKTTFYEAFKKFTGKTPTEYLEGLKKEGKEDVI